MLRPAGVQLRGLRPMPLFERYRGGTDSTHPWVADSQTQQRSIAERAVTDSGNDD